MIACAVSTFAVHSSPNRIPSVPQLAEASRTRPNSVTARQDLRVASAESGDPTSAELPISSAVPVPAGQDASGPADVTLDTTPFFGLGLFAVIDDDYP